MSVARLFFLLSGEHESLPVSEAKAILEAEGYTYKTIEKLDQVLRLETDINCVEILKRRAALTRLCAQELFTCEARMASIIKTVKATKLDQVLRENETFVVRVKHVKTYSSNINGMTLEQKLGELILQGTRQTKVKLKNPGKAFIGILTNQRFIFGQKLIDIPARPFVLRRPRKRPFFHPSAMQPKLARCMVNLAQPRAGDVLLDPFCGTGTMLIEASLINCQAVGADVQRRMARGTLKNMAHFKTKPLGVIIADARNPPISKADCVVTDPPYGTSSTTLKRTREQIFREVLVAVHGLLKPGRRICIAAPKKLKVASLGTSLGHKHLESHFVYVHRSLTREIAVFEKV
jgi:tRNA (guanine10-N2)-dimethyltransferase